MDLDDILLTVEEAMEKAVEYLKHELRGVRTGRATTGMVEFVKVDYYGSPTDLRQLAMISVPEPTQLLIKPFNASDTQTIVKSIQSSGLGLNPNSDGKQIRLNIPDLSGERRQQLIGSIKQIGEQAKVTMRNARRDANKHVDQQQKDKSQHVSEDDAEATKEEIQDLIKKFEKHVGDALAIKAAEIQEV